ncbi:MAG: Lrp/AsnC family transcriptional regulator [Pseudomonadota bacterium]
MIKIDEADKRILRALQQDCRLTSDQLGEACGLSPTAALKRAKRLRSSGIISKEVAIVSPDKIGMRVLAIVMVTLERENRQTIDAFKQDLRKSGEIIQAYYVTGDVDFVLTIAARSMNEYEEFTRDFFYDRNGSIKTFKTLVVLDAVKTAGAVDI